ncbi:S8 family peptidase [Deinococcus sonorensis]|uniref:S8 family serine peptidase n=2 Tax=Deinococcus sonorensis TaxID=309891 RepID=A0AAU7U9S2_9DEIO
MPRISALPVAVPLATLALLVGCGNPAPPAYSPPLSLQALSMGSAKKYAFIHTLSIPSTLTLSALQSSSGGRVLEFYPDLGSAIVANNVAARQPYDVTVESNTTRLKIGDARMQGFNAWSSGFNAWSSGFTAWSSGFTTWSTGNSALATTFTENMDDWNAIQLSGAQALVPELGQGIKVAVLDTGLDLNHPAFSGHVDTANMYDFVAGTPTPQDVSNGTSSGSEGYGHGTAVASLVLQIAPKATILPLRVLDTNGCGDIQTIANAISYAVSAGAKVINLSLGSTTDVWALNSAIQSAISRGVTVVAAAGNSGDTNVLYPARNALANGNNLQAYGSVSVGSVTNSLTKSAFSTYGSYLELTAPGEGLKTAFPNNQTVLATGTSFSTPVVSGALALALSAGVPSANRYDVSALLNALDSTATLNNDSTYRLGYGTLNLTAFIHKYR